MWAVNVYLCVCEYVCVNVAESKWYDQKRTALVLDENKSENDTN